MPTIARAAASASRIDRSRPPIQDRLEEARAFFRRSFLTLISLAAIEPSGVVKRAGGTLDWTDSTVFVSSGKVRREIKGLRDESGIGLAAAESVPARCSQRVLPKR